MGAGGIQLSKTETCSKEKGDRDIGCDMCKRNTSLCEEVFLAGCHQVSAT